MIIEQRSSLLCMDRATKIRPIFVMLGAQIEEHPGARPIPGSTTPALNAFRDAVKRFTRRNYRNREFVLIRKLDEWIRSSRDMPMGTDTSVSWLDLLLLEAAGQAYDLVDGKLQCSLLEHFHFQLEHGSSYFRVFSILLHISAGHLIQGFISNVLDDSSLPVDQAALKKCLEKIGIIGGDNLENFVCQFEAAQYMFCCRALDDKIRTVYLPAEIVPFYSRDILSTKGEVAEVSRIVVPQDYVSPRMEDLSLRFISETGRNPDKCFEFAIKTFHDKPSFEAELENLRLAENVSSVVRCLFVFEICGKFASLESQPEYNIVLELAQYDMADLLRGSEPPILPSGILEVWESLLSILEAVGELHSLSNLKGWHADLKPENIIRVGKRWKVADLGFSKLQSHGNATRSRYIRGTITYGAPETITTHIPNSTPIGSAIDMWSLGAIFSTIATWIVLGPAGVQSYVDLRRNATQNSAVCALADLLPPGDYFHDQTRLLPEVRAWHELLRHSVRKHDQVTAKVIDLVEDGMLVWEAKHRFTAFEIHRRLAELLQSARCEPSSSEAPSGKLWQEYESEILSCLGYSGLEVVQCCQRES